MMSFVWLSWYPSPSSSAFVLLASGGGTRTHNLGLSRPPGLYAVLTWEMHVAGERIHASYPLSKAGPELLHLAPFRRLALVLAP
jgi:hypothetical protein